MGDLESTFDKFQDKIPFVEEHEEDEDDEDEGDEEHEEDE